MSEYLKLALFSAFTCVVTAFVAIFLAYMTAEILDAAKYIPLMAIIYYFVAIAGIVYVSLEMLDNV